MGQSLVLRCVLWLASFLLAASCLANNTVDGRYISASWFVAGSNDAADSAMTIAFDIQPQEGWHIYWQNPGESGYAPEVIWIGEGISAGQLMHPAPVLFDLAGIPSYIHEGQVTLLQRLKFAAPHDSLKAELDLLVCSDRRCVPEVLSFDQKINQLPVASERMQQASSLMPLVVTGSAEIVEQGQVFQLRLKNVAKQAITDVVVFPVDSSLFSAHQAQTWRVEGQDLIASIFRGNANSDALTDVVAVVTNEIGTQQAFTLPPSGPIKSLPEVDEAAQVSVLWVLFAALMGGIVLNLMPCVFPVLSLKVFAITRAGMNPRQARIEALAYTAGTTLSVTALGVIILMVRASGEAMGWAFQLQNVYVLFALYMLVFLIGLNLLGLFELPSINANGGNKDGWLGAFGTGVLAAFVATPCTGPFMAGALGAALILPMGISLIIFSALGLGLGLPFILLAFSETLRCKLPSPGPWMEVLRHWLALPMALTALGLLWIISRQVEISTMIMIVVASTGLLALMAWLGSAQRNFRSTCPASILSLALVSATMIFIKPHTLSAKEDGHFDQQVLSAALSTGQPTLLYFTADWCLTCKVNEVTSINNDAVKKVFKENNVQVIVADWTRGDKVITEFLTREGVAGVPLYIWYSSEGDKQILPQILTSQLLVDLATKG